MADDWRYKLKLLAEVEKDHVSMSISEWLFQSCALKNGTVVLYEIYEETEEWQLTLNWTKSEPAHHFGGKVWSL